MSKFPCIDTRNIYERIDACVIRIDDCVIRIHDDCVRPYYRNRNDNDSAHVKYGCKGVCIYLLTKIMLICIMYAMTTTSPIH